jgi:hypothetical protein
VIGNQNRSGTNKNKDRVLIPRLNKWNCLPEDFCRDAVIAARRRAEDSAFLPQPIPE